MDLLLRCDYTHFYPRSPCGERQASFGVVLGQQIFLSTLSLRRATANAVDQILPGHISIHALLAESDGSGHISKARSKHFYPRSPCGERPSFIKLKIHQKEISIHALLAESDL